MQLPSVNNWLNSKSTFNNPECVHQFRNEDKVEKIRNVIFSSIIFPLAVYNVVHSLIGRFAIIPVADLSDQTGINQARNRLAEDSNWVVKRIRVAVNGTLIDAAIMGRSETLHNQRWMLFANGHASFYEYTLHQKDMRRILKDSNSNILCFNYPGVGMSRGLPTRKGIRNAHIAMQKFLEESLNAKEIVFFGHSFGAVVQSEAVSSFKDGVKYLSIRSRTFSNLQSVVCDHFGKIAAIVLKFFGWNLNTGQNRNSTIPELILQTGNVSEYTSIEDKKIICHDGVISRESSLAESILSDKNYPFASKRVVGIPEKHNAPFTDSSKIAHWIDSQLKV